MADLASITGYPFFPVPQDDFATVVQHSRTKKALAFAYKPSTPDSMVGTIHGLLPKYAALHQILHTSLAPKTGSSDTLWCTTINLLIYAHEGRKVDVLNFMYEEMKSCVYDKKSCVFPPFIQALIEMKYREKDRLLHKFPITLCKRHVNYRPLVHEDLLSLVGKEPRLVKVSAAARAIEVGGSSSRGAASDDPTALAHSIASSPSFSKKDKNMLFRGFNNLFKMCLSTARRQVVETNFRKSQMRQVKAAREHESGVTGPRGLRTLTVLPRPTPTLALPTFLRMKMMMPLVPLLTFRVFR